MSSGKRLDARGKGVLKAVKRVFAGGGAVRNREYERQRVLDPVIQLPHHEQLLAFRDLALRQIDHRDDATADRLTRKGERSAADQQILDTRRVGRARFCRGWCRSRLRGSGPSTRGSRGSRRPARGRGGAGGGG